MLPKRNINVKNKTPASNVQSLAARRYQQANLHRSGVRLSSDYSTRLRSSTLRIICGVKISSNKMAGLVIFGGLGW